jgi:hypothetical protein
MQRGKGAGLRRNVFNIVGLIVNLQPIVKL